MSMHENDEDCSWQEVYRLNGVVLNSEESFDELDLEEIEEIALGYSSPLKPLIRFDIPEIILERE